jgi:rhodanese-related sulfurtransferase
MSIEQVGADAWQRWVEEHDGMLLDVREPFEWQQTGVLPDSKLISMAELPASLDQLSTESPILVVCRTGNRSQHAAAWLESHGYRAANLAGGVVAVARATQEAS